MKIAPCNSIYFTSNDKTQNRNKIVYPVIQAVGAAVGYAIPLKEIDGPDVPAFVNGSQKIVLEKTKVPNIVGKWKNALLGAFVGTGIAIVADVCMNKKSKNSIEKN